MLFTTNMVSQVKAGEPETKSNTIEEKQKEEGKLALEAQEIYEKAKEYNKDPAEDPAPIITELLDKRTANSKSFMHDDGSISVAAYPYDIHYQKMENMRR